ncbi:extracellular catalytic domain type 2 short-chain-length polyhydroxyalkanoate depolymerase [Allopseudospirillum japonicum]|nr:PHB depolymerase family esterase [Allopseudospirillum japonicum]
MSSVISKFAAVLGASVLLGGCMLQEEVTYPALSVFDVEAVSVSGISSGGYMASQLHFAYPEIYTGVAIFAAGPYGCAAQGGVSQALTQCMQVRDGAPKVETLVQQVRTWAEAEVIGDPELMRTQAHKVWIYRAGQDGVLDERVTQTTTDLYRHWVADQHLKVVTLPEAAHALPTADYGAACDVQAPPYINQCDYDGVGAALKHLYPDLKEPLDAPGMLMTFDQRPFFKAQGAKIKGLLDYGYLFVPKTCEEGAPCKLHVALHGCEQSAQVLDETFVRHSGYLQWAAANRMLVLFPQAKKNLANPMGCWDWWGYESTNFYSRQGSQVAAITRMVQHISGQIPPIRPE